MRLFHTKLIVLIVTVLIGTANLPLRALPSTSKAELCTLAPRLTIGKQGKVTPGKPNLLLDQPGRAALHPNTIKKIGLVHDDEPFTVLDGPTCVDKINWWKITYQGKTGWTGEGDETGYWVEPFKGSQVDTPTPTFVPTPVVCPGFITSRLVVGQKGRVTPPDNNAIRSEPAAGKSIGKILAGDNFNVIEGPVCAKNMAWWKVEYKGLVGWTSEGEGEIYWVEPYEEGRGTLLRIKIYPPRLNTMECKRSGYDPIGTLAEYQFEPFVEPTNLTWQWLINGTISTPIESFSSEYGGSSSWAAFGDTLYDPTLPRKGTLRLHLIKPEDLLSNEVEYDVTCP